MDAMEERDERRDESRTEPTRERGTTQSPGLNAPGWQSYADENPGKGPFGII
jgi:hypothetical protein